MKIQELTYRGSKVLIGVINTEVKHLIKQLTNFQVYADEFQKIHLLKRKKEFLSSRILLNQLLKREVQVVYNNDNKPFLKDNSAEISITHSKNYVVVIAHQDCKVGVDIELRTNKVINVAPRFLNKIEQKYFQNNISKIEIAWSAKEALYKIIGKTAVDFAKSFEILPFLLNDTGDIFVLHTDGSRIYKLRYIQNKTYTLAMVIDKKLKL